MDGVISDTQAIYAKVESELLKNYGIDMSPDKITARFAGVGSKEMFRQIFADFGKEMPILAELEEKEMERINFLVKDNIREIPGTREFILRLKNHGLPLAVASGSRVSFIERVLSKLNLRNKFDAIASAEEVKRGKPEPDVFLLAANRLSIKPKECLVIEDGVSGMIAAKRAGMRCIGLVRNGAFLDCRVDLVVKNLRDVSITMLNTECLIN